MRAVEVAVAYVGETEIVSHFGVYKVVSCAATYLQTAVEAFEEVFRERGVGLTLLVVLYLSAHSESKEASEERLDGEVLVNVISIFQYE